MVRSKYNAKKTEVDGIMFDSRMEAERYKELKLLQAAGEIKDLDLQTKFQLQPGFLYGVRKMRPINYFADFTYKTKDGIFVVEDVKGVKTKEYQLKKKMLMYVHGIEPVEVVRMETKRRGRNERTGEIHKRVHIQQSRL